MDAQKGHEGKQGMASTTGDKLDFLTKLRIRELILMGLITITAVLANLPEEYITETLGISPDALIAVLAIAVIIGLFLYLKFGLFVAVLLLIAGANMPDQIAATSATAAVTCHGAYSPRFRCCHIERWRS